jgi:hypothetical protein
MAKIAVLDKIGKDTKDTFELRRRTDFISIAPVKP